MYRTVVRGVGSYLPELRLTNDDLGKMVETSDEWIVTRTGISERRLTGPTEATSDLAYPAALAALEHAGLQASDIDLLIVATSTPDHPFPPVACQLQARLGCRQITAFDVSATCIGFLSALEIATQFIQNGKHKHALVIGADTLSKLTDYTDRTTCILFGDGAGAFILSRAESATQRGVLHTATHSDGEFFSDLYVPGGGSKYPHTQMNGDQAKPMIVMDGRKIFKLSVTAMAKTIGETLKATSHTSADIDWLIPHQANQRIIEAVAKHVDFPLEKVVSTIKYIGNNSAATIPVAVDTAVKDGRVNRGDTLLLVAFGAGLVWGSILLEY